MATESKIEWTELTWNPTIGCTKISPGCKNCYAEKMAYRLQAMGLSSYKNGFELTLLEDRLNEPLNRKKPSVYFVNSMSDLFHADIPFSFIDKVFKTIELAHWHTFQILTKRADRMAEYFYNRTTPKNAWLGVSVEDQKYGLPRINQLIKINAKVRFLSIEPLLEDLGKIDFTGIHWVIVGGESGSKARPMQPAWVKSIKEQCITQKTAFFFKQWGAFGEDGKKRPKKNNGRLINGKAYSEQPNTNN